MGLIRVKNDGKIYEFDPDKQRKKTPLDYLVSRVPMSMKWKRRLTELSIRLKGIKVKEDTSDNCNQDLGRG